MNPLSAILRLPGRGSRLLRTVNSYRRGRARAAAWPQPQGPRAPDERNPFRDYFDSVEAGPGIWKWHHYFEIYQRHFGKFIGRPEVNVLEIGVYSGGSIGMWRHVFGPGCRVFGVDVEPACRAYEREGVRILIGDQGDPSFWARARRDLPPLDIVIDDGGHLPDQQIVTLEESLPLLRPGGVYLCEDIQHPSNRFLLYLAGFAGYLNVSDPYRDGPQGPTVPANGLQNTVKSVTLYPYVAVIETRDRPVGEFESRRHGTEWQPFYEDEDSVAHRSARSSRA